MGSATRLEGTLWCQRRGGLLPRSLPDERESAFYVGKQEKVLVTGPGARRRPLSTAPGVQRELM